MPSPVVLETNLAGLHARASRQGARRLRSRRPPADRRDRSHFRVRLRARLGHSRQGQGAHAAVGVLVRSSRRPHAAPSVVAIDVDDVPRRHAAASRRAARPVDARAQDGRRCRSNASRAATCPARAGRTISKPARSAAIALPPGLRESDRLPAPIFTPATKAETGPRREHQRSRRPARSSARDLIGTSARSHARRSTSAASSTPRRAASSSPTPSSSSAMARRHELDASDRRSADARLVALLAAGQLRAGPGQPSFDKQFVRDYLEAIGWNKQPPVPSLPDDVVAAHA